MAINADAPTGKGEDAQQEAIFAGQLDANGAVLRRPSLDRDATVAAFQFGRRDRWQMENVLISRARQECEVERFRFRRKGRSI